MILEYLPILAAFKERGFLKFFVYQNKSAFTQRAKNTRKGTITTSFRSFTGIYYHAKFKEGGIEEKKHGSQVLRSQFFFYLTTSKTRLVELYLFYIQHRIAHWANHMKHRRASNYWPDWKISNPSE